MFHRIHILGASGSSTTTLGQALAERLGSVHFDTDWQESIALEEQLSVLMLAIS
jgi:adenylate kinase family enzyme